MKFGKIFGFFKKGARKAKSGKKKGGAQPSYPSGTRVGVVGHTNSGKTCYFTVLHECCKTDRRLQISVSDHATASEFLAHYRSIWGLSTAVESGTAVDLRGEQKFPEPTETSKVLQFNATVDGGGKMNVVTLDYPGKAIDINESSEQKDDVTDFLVNADGLMFFYDPKLLQAELQNQAHVASFVNIIEQIAPLGSRLPVPIALVVTKADILPGFTGEDQTVLVPTGDESILAEDFDIFIQRVLDSNRLRDNSAWAGSVRELLLKLRDFIRLVVGRTLDFQIFFSTNTGQTPEKIGTDVGRSIYKPPRKPVPYGVKEPMYWLLNSVVNNRRISRFRGVARWAAMLALVWIVIFSIPFAYHFWWQLPDTVRIEENALEPYDGNMVAASTEEHRRIGRAYDQYSRSWMVRSFFRAYEAPAKRIYEVYNKFNVADAEQRLNQAISQFASIVSDSSLWPQVSPVDSSITTRQIHDNLLATLNQYHEGDSTTDLYQRSERALTYWKLFTRALMNPRDTVTWDALKTQATQYDQLYGDQISSAEKELGEAFFARKVEKAKQAEAVKTAMEFDEAIVDRINGNEDPTYRLDRVKRDLRNILNKLDPSDVKNRRRIEAYLDEVDKWGRFRTYTVKVENVPGGSHLHIQVTDSGQDPAWTELDMILQGREIELRWRPGQDIHIALDTSAATCQNGRNPADKRVFSDKYSLFEIDGDISFNNVNQTITLRFEPALKDRLPELK